jgi:hypothetical protein
MERPGRKLNTLVALWLPNVLTFSHGDAGPSLRGSGSSSEGGWATPVEVYRAAA